MMPLAPPTAAPGPPTGATPTAAPAPPTDATELTGTAAEALCLVVAPGNGRFQPSVSAGQVAAGGLLGSISAGGGRRHDVRTPADVIVQGLLALPGHLVVRGQALAWATKVRPA